MYITGSDVLRASKLIRPCDESLISFPEGATTLGKIIHNLKVSFLEKAFFSTEAVYEVPLEKFERWVREAHQYVSDEMSENEVREEIIRELWVSGFDLKRYLKEVEATKKFFIFTRKLKKKVLFVSIIPVECRRNPENFVFPSDFKTQT